MIANVPHHVVALETFVRAPLRVDRLGVATAAVSGAAIANRHPYGWEG